MPIILSEATKKSILHHTHPQKKVIKDDEKAPSSDESDEGQSSADLQPTTSGEKKKIIKQSCDIPVFEDYLPNQDENLDNKVKWLVKQQLTKNLTANLAKKRATSTSSSDLDSTNNSEDDSVSDSSEKPLPVKKKMKTTLKKRSHQNLLRKKKPSPRKKINRLSQIPRKNILLN